MDKKALLEHIRMIRERCWKGYKPAKGKKPYSKGSCVKESKDFGAKFGTDADPPPKKGKKVRGVDDPDIFAYNLPPGEKPAEELVRQGNEQKARATAKMARARSTGDEKDIVKAKEEAAWVAGHGAASIIKRMMRDRRFANQEAKGKPPSLPMPAKSSGRKKGRMKRSEEAALQQIANPKGPSGKPPIRRIPKFSTPVRQDDDPFPGAPFMKGNKRR